MTLVITEKPSVAKAYASALGVKQRREGYFDGNGYLISWCIGHLVTLADASLYDPEYASWNLGQLPILPKNWKLVTQVEKQKQFGILRDLMHREDVDTVINACDAGREGELIFRNVYALAGCGKPTKRLWLSSMEDEAIRVGFQNLHDGSLYDHLYAAAFCRAKADWLVGINATRCFSLLYHRKLRIGRVMSPTLALIVQREAEIRSFSPAAFYTVSLNLDLVTVTGDRLSCKEDADFLALSCRGKNAVIRTIETREKSESAPALYDLTTLQREANKKLGFTAQQTLDYLQSLYEKKLCTYPRTESRYLTDDMLRRVPEIVDISSVISEAVPPDVIESQAVCDSSKVTDHYAIIPTGSCKSFDLNSLLAPELSLLKLIALGVVRAVSGPYRYTETVVTAECEGADFSVKGKTVNTSGWRRLYLREDEPEASLSPLQEGMALPVVASSVKQGETSPPAKFTEASLLSAMESAGNQDMPEGSEHRGIGTPATRSGIIEKLISDGYLMRKKLSKKTVLLPTGIGNSLITVLPEQLQSPLLTAEWEQQLKGIENGQVDPKQFDAAIASLVSEMLQAYTPVSGADVLFQDSGTVVGKCPRCGHPVIEKSKGYFCLDRNCRFALWKDSRFFEAKRKKLTSAVAEALLTDGKVLLKGCFSERKNKYYDATVVLEDDGERTDFRLVF